MPTIEGLDPALQTVGTLIFVAVVAIFSGWSLVFGRKKAQPETKEFSMTGQLADMGPVTKLVEGVGLLYQQQVRTNMVLERLAVAAEAAIEDHRKAEAERDMAEEIDRESERKARIMAEDMVRDREEEAAGRRPRKTT